MAQDPDKAQLIAELARSRVDLAANFGALCHDLDFSSRARQSFKRGPTPWLGAAAVIGLLIARLPPRTKKVVKVSPKFQEKSGQTAKAGLLLGALKIVVDLARPALTKWATQQFTAYASRPAAADNFRR